MWTALVNFLLPQPCLNCGRRGEAICQTCLASLPAAAAGGLAAAFDYADPVVRVLVWRLKYRGQTSLAKLVAPNLRQAILEEVAERRLFSRRPLLVAPIPLTRTRERERGYNQAALLAAALVTLEPTIFRCQKRLLAKIKDTPSQVSLPNRAARLTNLRGAFTVPDPAAVGGETIILVDDVTTTGATLTEAKQTLLAAGAAAVIGLTLARGE